MYALPNHCPISPQQLNQRIQKKTKRIPEQDGISTPLNNQSAALYLICIPIEMPVACRYVSSIQCPDGSVGQGNGLEMSVSVYNPV